MTHDALAYLPEVSSNANSTSRLSGKVVSRDQESGGSGARHNERLAIGCKISELICAERGIPR
ncbi:MAG: hypothetical protein AB7F89_24675, partial [Pirellulaceae bacterium]